MDSDEEAGMTLADLKDKQKLIKELRNVEENYTLSFFGDG